MPVIVKNLLLRDRAAHVTYRVIDIVSAGKIGLDDIGEYVVLMDTDVTKKAMPHGVPKNVVLNHIAQREWVVLDEDEPSIDLEGLTDAEKRVLEERWKVLQLALNSPYELLNPKGRAELAREFLRKKIATRPMLYLVLRLYWARGPRKQSLLPDYRHCGSPGTARVPASESQKTGRPRFIQPGRGIAMTAEHRKKMSVALATFRMGEKQNQPWLVGAYHHLLLSQYPEYVRARSDGRAEIENYDAVPTFEQFRYFWSRQYDLATRLQKRIRPRRFEALTKILASGTLRDLRGPGVRYEIDATIVDVYVVSRYNPNHIIGRPTLYLVVDQFSRLIVGYYLGLEPPCWVGAMLALWSCNLDKVELCRHYGIEITAEEWPTGHMPLHLLSDRGEGMSRIAEALSVGFGIDVENSAPYCGAAKSVVERSFGVVQVSSFGPYIPGYVDKKFYERGDTPPPLKAVVNLDQLTRILLAAIIIHNHKVIREYQGTPDSINHNVEFTPVALWHWGVKHLRCEARKFSEDHLARYLWPEEKVVLQKRGLHYCRGLWYYGTKLREQNWFLRAFTEGRELSVRIHPQRLGEAFVVSDDDRGTMLSLPIAPRSERFATYTLSELAALDLQKNRQNAAAKWRNQPVTTKMHGIVRTGVAAAKAAAKANRDPFLSDRQRLKNIRANREAELAAMTAEALAGHLGIDEKGDVIDVTPEQPFDVEEKALQFVNDLFTTTTNKN
nr:MAG: hypothetical protein DIU57_11250 [Pseudomonadota bacterium]